MNAPTHDELQELLPGAALEILDAADLQLVMEHAKTCPECAGLLRDYRDVAASLALTAPRQQLDPSRSSAMRERLLARARVDEHPLSGARRRFQVDRWSGWLVAAGLAGVLLMHHAVHRPLAYGWLAAGGLTILLVAVMVYARIQRSRAAALRDRLASLERETKKPAG